MQKCVWLCVLSRRNMQRIDNIFVHIVGEPKAIYLGYYYIHTYRLLFIPNILRYVTKPGWKANLIITDIMFRSAAYSCTGCHGCCACHDLGRPPHLRRPAYLRRPTSNFANDLQSLSSPTCSTSTMTSGTPRRSSLPAVDTTGPSTIYTNTTRRK